MGATFGGTMKLQGEPEYRKALQQIKAEIKTTSSEMKVLSAEFGKNATSIEGLEAKNQNLNRALAQQQQQVKILQGALAVAKETYGETDQRTLEWQQKLNDARADVIKTSNAIKDNEKAMGELKSASSDSSEEYRKALKQIETEIKTTSSEMDVLSAEFGKNATSIEGLEAKNQNLNRALAQQQQQVKILQGALAAAKETYGETDQRTLEWRQSLNKAQADVIKTSNAIKDNEKAMEELKSSSSDSADEIDEFKESEDDAGQSSLKLGDIIKANLISDAIKSGLSALANGIKKVGASLLDMGKQAVSSYSDYEQLAGGVETLFKDSAGVVKDYANNAYQTSGMNANQYMETITGFSASLLQSLGGDTAKAAEVGNMAVIDMSDNANKMGTDIASIQNAYQGFAKQNYTMLDNLKLGYGGTKEEMQRLLGDAEELTGVKYDINNLNDVYQAIHVIQGELDITGTTAKEASTTIQGSLSAMKSSWQNLLTGLATGGSNISGLITNVASSAMQLVDNVLPIIDNIAAQIPQLINGLLEKVLESSPKIVESITNIINTLATSLESNMPMIMDVGMQLIETLIQGIVTMLPTLVSMAGQFILSLANAMIESLPQFINTGVQIIIELINGITSALPQIIQTIVDMIPRIVQAITDNLPLIIQAGITLLLSLTQGLIDAIPQLIDALPQIISALINGLLSAIPQLIDAGIQLLTALVTALPTIIQKIVEVLPQIITGIISALLDNLPLIVQAGIDLLVALIQALPQIITTIVQALPKIITGIVNALINNIDKIILAGVQLFIALITNLPKIIFEIVKAIPKIIKGIIDAFISFVPKIGECGLNLIKGLWNGIKDAGAWLWDKISGFFGGIVDRIKDFFGIHSPARKHMPFIGAMMAQGLGVGFKNEMDDVNGQIRAALPTEINTGLNTKIDSTVTSSTASRIAGAVVAAMRGSNDGVSDMLSVINQKLSGIESNTAADTTIKFDDREFGRVVRALP